MHVFIVTSSGTSSQGSDPPPFGTGTPRQCLTCVPHGGHAGKSEGWTWFHMGEEAEVPRSTGTGRCWEGGRLEGRACLPSGLPPHDTWHRAG